MKTVGADLGGTKFRAAKVDEQGLSEDIVSININAKGTQQKIIRQLTGLLDEVVDEEVEAIGIGAPGIMDMETGVVYEVVNLPALKKVPLKKILEDQYNVPVKMDNDANCYATAEHQFGKGKPYNNLVGLILGTGTGAGLILNGQVYHGHNTGAGEFGEIAYLDGTFEDYTSSKFFHEKNGIRGEVLFERAENGNEDAQWIFKQFGTHVGKLLSVIVYSVAPEAIILGGGASQNWRFFSGQMMKTLEKFSYDKSFSSIKVDVSELREPGILGAAGLCYPNIKL